MKLWGSEEKAQDDQQQNYGISLGHHSLHMVGLQEFLG
jgi:hypothetical protein